MMRRLYYILILAVIAVGCKDKIQTPSAADFTGIIITEVAANADKPATDSWVEIYNTSSRDISLAGLGLYVFDGDADGKELTIMDEMSIRAGERLVFSTEDMTLLRGISSDSDFELVLGVSADKDIVDRFSRDKAGVAGPTARYGSYQKMPETGGDWVITSQATRRMKNFDAKPNAIWAWSSHVDAWVADDFKVLKEMKQLGYDHLLLNYYAFDGAEYVDKTRQLIAAAKECGVKVHAWMQVFREDGKWVNPIENLGNRQGRYKQEEFDRLIAKANGYIDNFGVDGIHLDYIRFSGTGDGIANYNNFKNGVTATGAITGFCRQLRESVDSRLEGVILSAAMVTPENRIYYFGQEPSEMGEYIDILIPMAYKSTANRTYDSSWIVNICQEFTSVTDAQVWAGIQTYTHYSGSQNVKGMTASEVLVDAEAVQGRSDCSGLALFRYALGEFPDVNDLWD